MKHQQAFAKVLAAAALALGAQFAQAGVVVSLFGDVDPSYDGTGCPGVTDCYTSGSKSWTQTFTLDGPILSATIEIGAWQLGLVPPAGVPQLFLDGKLVGALTDTDGCDGTSAPGTQGCAFFYAIDLLQVGALADLADGTANLSVPTSNFDVWLLDFSRITITTGTVPEPATAPLGLLALAGMALLRRRRG